jgi:excisionase family DNA binding protein
MQDEFLTAEEVAERLKMHPRTVRRMLARGDIPGRRLGKGWRVSATELQKFIAGGQPEKTDRKDV